MLFNSSNTGRTDLRDTDVQQPNTTSTFSTSISSRAFSANNGQFEAGSTTTASTFLPNRPPFLFRSSIIIKTESFKVVSEIAIVPDKECRTPTLITSSALTVGADIPSAPAATTAAADSFPIYLVSLNIFTSVTVIFALPPSEQRACQHGNKVQYFT
jgi:hypothetical protein